jgi:hypothetical protein
MHKFHLKLLISNQKIAARKCIARYESQLHSISSINRDKILKRIKKEKEFLTYNFNNLQTIREIISIIHNFRHKGISKYSSYKDCLECKKALKSISTQLPEQNDIVNVDTNLENELKPKFGNLISILEQEVFDEKNKIESKNFPSQNDLTRWALKDSVLSYYQGLNIPENMVVVDTLYDDRLISKLAPDFDVIAQIWIEKLNRLLYNTDKYALEKDEIDKAESDLADGMRGSAFEKQLDRYREEFMKKLKR